MNLISTISSYAYPSTGRNSFAYWITGRNNFDSIKKLKNDEYIFNEDPNRWNKSKQYVEEAGIILAKWTALLGTTHNLAVDFDVIPTSEPHSYSSVLETLGSYPYTSIKWMVNNARSQTMGMINYVYDYAKNHEEKDQLAANIALCAVSILSLKPIWKNLQQIEFVNENPRFSLKEKGVRNLSNLVNLGINASIALLACSEQKPEAKLLLSAAILAHNYMPSSTRGLSLAKSLLTSALTVMPLYNKMDDWGMIPIFAETVNSTAGFALNNLGVNLQSTTISENINSTTAFDSNSTNQSFSAQ